MPIGIMTIISQKTNFEMDDEADKFVDHACLGTEKDYNFRRVVRDLE
jgi:hypothetical protein